MLGCENELAEEQISAAPIIGDTEVYINHEVGGTLSFDNIEIVIPPFAMERSGIVYIGRTGNETEQLENPQFDAIGSPFTLRLPTNSLLKSLKININESESVNKAATYLLFSDNSFQPIEFSSTSNFSELFIKNKDLEPVLNSNGRSAGFREIIIALFIPNPNSSGLKMLDPSNCYDNDPYEPSIDSGDKVVILIHGFTETPKTWCNLISYVNSPLNEPIFEGKKLLTFGYPSGWPIQASSWFLHRQLQPLLEKNVEIDIVAYSMGGIVARYMTEIIDPDIAIDDLVTIASPHLGTLRNISTILDLATRRQIRSFNLVGAQLLANSPFLNNLNSQQKPESIDYHLIGVVNEDGVTDGLVSLQSAHGVPESNSLYTVQIQQSGLVHGLAINNDDPSIQDEIFLQIDNYVCEAVLGSAHYPFEGNANDISGFENHGQEFGDASYGPGVIGSAVYFDGDEDYVVVPNAPQITVGTESFTVSLWAKFNTNPAVDALFAKWHASENGYHLRYNTDNELNFEVGKNGTESRVREAAALNDGQWHHVVAVRDFENLKLQVYVDGLLVGEEDDITQDISTDMDLFIGRYSWWDQGDMNGAIDEFIMEKRAWSQDDVSDYFSSIEVPVIEVPLSSDVWEFYHNNTQTYYAPTPGIFEVTTQGLVGYGPDLPRSGYFLITKEDVDISNKILYLKWKANGQGQFSEIRPLIDYPDGDTDPDDGNNFNFNRLSTGNVYNGSALIQDDEWYYTKVTIGPSSFTSTTSSNSYIDSGGIEVQTWSGPMNQFIGKLALLAGDTRAGTAGYIVLQEFRMEPNNSTPVNLVASYPFNGNANDISGNSNHGTTAGVVLTTDRFGNANSAYEFDGVDDYIDIPNFGIFDGSQDYSMSAWINSYGFENERKIISLRGERNVFLGTNVNPDNSTGTEELLFFTFDGNRNYVDAGTIGLNSWHHLAATYSTTDGMKIYLDGVLIDSNSYNGTPSVGSLARSNQIGAYVDHPAHFWKGKIDDVKIYNKTLTDSEVLAEFGAPGI